LTSFLFAATPLPSNMLFITYGMMKAKSIGLYIGFWFGRLVSYYVMITISEAVLTPLLELFEDKIIGIIVADIVGIGSVIFFTCINWQALLFERKLRFVRPKIWLIISNVLSIIDISIISLFNLRIFSITYLF